MNSLYQERIDSETIYVILSVCSINLCRTWTFWWPFEECGMSVCLKYAHFMSNIGNWPSAVVIGRWI